MRTREEILKELNNMKISEDNSDENNGLYKVVALIGIIGLIIYLTQ